MLLVQETATLEPTVRGLMKSHHLQVPPHRIVTLYRPFWIGKALYRATDRGGAPILGTLVFLADARIPHWALVGAYQHQRIENVLDLRDFQVNFWIEDQSPEPDAEILEPLLDTSELPTQSKLLGIRRLLARTLKLGRISFEEDVEYHLIYRPYWEMEFQTRRGKTDVAMISRDELLIRKR